MIEAVAEKLRNNPTMSNLIIGGQEIKPGSTRQIELPVVRLYTDTDISMPIHVISGRKPGPRVFVAGAIHGDEINGIEIIRRLIQRKSFKLSAGTLILVPIIFTLFNSSKKESNQMEVKY